jgi:protein SCO1/2
VSSARTAAIALAIVAFTLLPVAIKARDLQLVDQREHSFTLADLKGAPLVVTFVSAHCYDVCPLINAQIAAAVSQAEHTHLKVRFLTVTLDPERDSAHDLRALANSFAADPQRWIVAGGKPGDVHGVMRAFHVTTQRGPDGYADAHTTLVYLVDSQGTLRTTMLASTDLSDRIIRTLRAHWNALAQGMQ